MKLFIDSSNKKFILGIIFEGEVTSYFEIDTQNNAAKNANKWLNDFLKSSEVKIEDINGFYVVAGPGSFTGVKVSQNIVNTISMLNNIDEFYTISSFDLVRKNKVRYVSLKFSKNKSYVKDYKNPFVKFSVETGFHKSNSVIGYGGFNKEELQMKLSSFKKVSQIKIIYPKNTYN